MTHKTWTARASAALVSLVAASALLAAPAQAHHSVSAEFDMSKRIVLEGVLQKVEFINPHSQMELLVKTPSGEMKTYHILTAGVAMMRRAGAGNKDLFKIGGTYKMEIHPARRGEYRGVLENITFPDGRTMGMSLN